MGIEETKESMNIMLPKSLNFNIIKIDEYDSKKDLCGKCIKCNVCKYKQVAIDNTKDKYAVAGLIVFIDVCSKFSL